MRVAENFSGSPLLSAAAMRGAIALARFVARITQNRLQILSSRASANFVLTAFYEVPLLDSKTGVKDSKKRPPR
jgi:hypothetical protein